MAYNAKRSMAKNNFRMNFSTEFNIRICKEISACDIEHGRATTRTNKNNIYEYKHADHSIRLFGIPFLRNSFFHSHAHSFVRSMNIQKQLYSLRYVYVRFFGMDLMR